MSRPQPPAGTYRRNPLLCALATAALLALVLAPRALAQPDSDDAANLAADQGNVRNAQAMRIFHDVDSGAQPTPPVIPQFEIDFDRTGLLATDQPGGETITSSNPFFQNLGTNGRTCFTCHQPQTGWTVSAASVQARFYASFGTDPIFRIVDGATCPNDDVSSIGAKLNAYSLLLSKGLIRIGLAFPAGAQFQIDSVADPYGCNTNPATGLTSATSGFVSVYRRPLPATNLGFLSTFMWDGRELNLQNQANDATMGHAQGAALTTPQQNAIVAFETGLFTAQIFDNRARDLDDAGAKGGPATLAGLVGSFFIGINDPFGLNLHNIPFTSEIFTLYDAWTTLPGETPVDESREAVARGEALFNDTPITIAGVAGINDVLGVKNFHGFCGTCHDTPNVGDHSVKAPLDIGIADAGALRPPDLDTADLPVFSITCTTGPLKGTQYKVTDPGRALISGNCADIGKLKGPILRGLAARAPYFHNGSAATLTDVVDFYNDRFGIGFTERQKRDLVAFLETL